VKINVFSLKRDDTEYEKSIVNDIIYFEEVNIVNKLTRILKIIVLNPIKYFKIIKLIIMDAGNYTFYDLFRYIRHLHIGLYYSDYIANEDFDSMYSHWETGTTIAAVINKFSGLKYSICLHANEIYAERWIPDWKFVNTKFIVVNNTYNKHYFNLITNYAYYKKIKIIRNVPPNIELKFINRKSPRTPLNLLSLGRLVHFKDHPTLLEACKLLAENDIEFKLRIGGSGDTIDLIKSLIKRYDIMQYVELLGAYEENDIWKFLDNSDIFVHASGIGFGGTRDGLPNVIIESMLACVPVISTYISSIPEAIENEKDGLLIPEKNPKALYDAICELNQNHQLYEKISKNSAIKAREIFNKSDTVTLLQETFNID